MLSLINWSLYETMLGIKAQGVVYGHYRLKNGDSINTSMIMKIYSIDHEVYVAETSSGTLYQLAVSEMNSQNSEETKRLLLLLETAQTGLTKEQLSEKQTEFEQWNQKREAILRNAWKWADENMENNELYLIMESIHVIKAITRYEDISYEVEPFVHVGMFQDSMLITDWEHGNLDFRYFPNWRIEPYEWSESLKKIYIHNVGNNDILYLAKGRVKACPDQNREIGTRKRRVPDKEIICPKGEITEIYSMYA